MSEPLSQRKDHLLHALYYLEIEQNEGPVDRSHPEIMRHNGEAVESLAEDGSVTEHEGKLSLTEAGVERARDVVRRHRLAERLMADVLGMEPDSGDYIAGEMEHIVSPELADSICTLLGHPTECPHRHRIPPGPCCQAGAMAVRPAVVPLTEMKAGQAGTVAYITCVPGPIRGGPRGWGGPPPQAAAKDDAEMRRRGGRRIGQMASVGLFPGQPIAVLQTAPTYVVRIGGTTLALDDELAACIRVRRSETSAAADVT
ncbi:MAG: metal-dependent transcriptional regulator [Armatimonadetes bacterium]|nr:metal-dependent transcriptional regulator [Armatimonadota bacterium]